MYHKSAALKNPGTKLVKWNLQKVLWHFDKLITDTDPLSKYPFENFASHSTKCIYQVEILVSYLSLEYTAEGFRELYALAKLLMGTSTKPTLYKSYIIVRQRRK